MPLVLLLLRYVDWNGRTGPEKGNGMAGVYIGLLSGGVHRRIVIVTVGAQCIRRNEYDWIIDDLHAR